MPATSESREFDRVRQAVLLGLFGGTAVGLGYLLFSIPGVELMTVTAALAGAALGPRLGAAVGGLAMGVFSLAHPLGAPVPVLLAAQVLGLALAGIAGGLAAPVVRRSPRTVAIVAAAAVGVAASLVEDVLTNLAVAVAFGWPSTATLLAGLPVAAVHAGTNAVAFATLLPALAGRLARLRRPGPRVIGAAVLLLIPLVEAPATAEEPVAQGPLAAEADSVDAVAATDTLSAAAADTATGVAVGADRRADANEVLFNRAASPRRFVRDWKRPLWDPFFASLRENLLHRTFWLPIQDGGLGGAMMVFGEPSTSPQPLVTRDGIPLGIGHRYLDDIDAVAITGQTMRATELGFDRTGGLGGAVSLRPYDPVPDRDLADTRWYKGNHETYLRDLHLLTARAPWRLGFDFQEILDNEGYDFSVPGDGRYPRSEDTFSGHAKFRSGRAILRRDLGAAGIIAFSGENVRKAKDSLPAYGLDHQDLWTSRADVSWQGTAAARPLAVTLWWVDIDVDWDRGQASYRKQEGARTGALASWGDAATSGRLDLSWGRWTVVDTGVDTTWGGAGAADTTRVQGELANLRAERSWLLGPTRGTLTLGGWWDEHGGWLLGGRAQLTEDRSAPRWSLSLERGGRAPRSDELATIWRFQAPGGASTVALPDRDLGREDEWRLAAGVAPRLLGFQLALDAAVRRLRDGIGWQALPGETNVGRWANGLELDSTTLRAAISRGGSFLGWLRFRAEGSYRSWTERGEARIGLPPELNWQVSLLWENHFFREDGILQLAGIVHHRGAMDDPWYLADPIALEATTRVDAIVGFRLVGTNLSASFLNVTGAENRVTAGSMDHGFEIRWRLNWVFHF